MVFIPSNKVSKVANLSFVRWLSVLKLKDKASKSVLNGEAGEWAINPEGTVNIRVKFFKDVPKEGVEQILGNTLKISMILKF